MQEYEAAESCASIDPPENSVLSLPERLKAPVEQRASAALGDEDVTTFMERKVGLWCVYIRLCTQHLPWHQT